MKDTLMKISVGASALALAASVNILPALAEDYARGDDDMRAVTSVRAVRAELDERAENARELAEEKRERMQEAVERNAEGLRATVTGRAEEMREYATTTMARFDEDRERMKDEIENRVEALAQLRERITSMKISSTTRESLNETLREQVADFRTLKDNVMRNATSTAEEVRSIAASHRIAALMLPKAQIIASAERTLSVVKAMRTVDGKLQTLIDNAVAAGADMSAATAALVDYRVKVDEAETLANVAKDGVDNLQPDDGDKTVFESNNATLKDARNKIADAHQALVAARKDIQDIRHALPKPTETATSTQE